MLPHALVIFFLYLIVILMLLIVLTFHEIGHFLLAKIHKVNVKEFSIGFGPKIISRTTKKGTCVSLRLIPLMAYVVLDSKNLRALYINDKKNKNYQWAIKPKPKGMLYLEDCSLNSFIQIMFGGVLLNFCAFLLAYIPAICLNPSFASVPFVSIGDCFKAIGMNMIGTGKGDIFGQIPALPSQVKSSMDWLHVFLGTFMMINLLTFLFNLFPLPPLDGWKITKQCVEKLSHKKLDERVEYYLTIFICIILLWIFVSGVVMDVVH